MIHKLFGRYQLTEKALDASWLKNEAIAHNIANADTPGYKRKDVRFEDYLNESNKNMSKFQARRTRKEHMPFPDEGKDVVIETDHSGSSMRLDGNNVDIEREMALMAKNNIRYNTLVQVLNTGLRRIKSAISEGRK